MKDIHSEIEKVVEEVLFREGTECWCTQVMCDESHGAYSPDQVKRILQEALTSIAERAREEALKEVEAKRQDCPHDSRSHCMEEMCWIHEEGGYNQAVDDIITELQSLQDNQ